MPRCEGLTTGSCPASRNDLTVNLGEGGLMLCSDCDKTRHLQWLATRSASNVTVNQRPPTEKSESEHKQTVHSSLTVATTRVYHRGKPAVSSKKTEMKNEASVGSISPEEICLNFTMSVAIYLQKCLLH